MKIKILHHQKYFGQSLPTFKSMDLNLLETSLQKLGFSTSLISFEELQNEIPSNDTFYLCGSHQNMDVKSYLDDVLDLECFENKIIPNRRLVKAHENKGFQGVLAKALGLPYEEQLYFIEPQSLNETKVIKLVNGAGSGGVKLCNNNKELNAFLFKALALKLGVKRLAYFLRAKFNSVRKINYHKEALSYYTPKEKYITQDFVPDLTCDFKVLVFMDKLFVLKRNTKKGDFRASGSGLFDFIDAPNEMLEFAFQFRKELDTPYVSMDIIEKNNGYSCIEYQCVHFGPYTQMNSDFYYERQENEWVKLSNDTVLEELIADSVYNYLADKNA
jgi:hypothetical protein